MVMNKLITRTEVVTPEMAKIYLSRSKGNRPINNRVVQQYARAMKRGEWMLNGEAIIFDNNGNLVNGHHRLNAVIKADCSAWFQITEGVEPSAFATFDCGLRRTAAQCLSLAGVRNYSQVASAIRSFIVLCRNQKMVRPAAENTPTNSEVADCYHQFQDTWDRIGTFISNARMRGFLPMGWIGGAYFYLLQQGRDEGDITYFFSQLCSLGTSENSTIEKLRTQLLRAKTQRRDLRADVKWALFVKTWNAFVEGRTISALKWQYGEETPTLVN